MRDLACEPPGVLGWLSQAVAENTPVRLTDYPQVDVLGLRYKSVNFSAPKCPRSPNR